MSEVREIVRRNHSERSYDADAMMRWFLTKPDHRKTKLSTLVIDAPFATAAAKRIAAPLLVFQSLSSLRQSELAKVLLRARSVLFRVDRSEFYGYIRQVLSAENRIGKTMPVETLKNLLAQWHQCVGGYPLWVLFLSFRDIARKAHNSNFSLSYTPLNIEACAVLHQESMVLELGSLQQSLEDSSHTQEIWETLPRSTRLEREIWTDPNNP